MRDTLLQIIAPHYCSGCAKIGTVLCENCKYDIIDEPFSMCFSCGLNLANDTGICQKCKVPYQRAWCVGQRQDILQRLIGNYKFNNARAAYLPLADLLDATLPVLPKSVHIVPIPTVPSHIRQRGYDHMHLIARQLAKRRQIAHTPVLERITTTKQRDANKSLRIKQAKAAFACTAPLDPDAIYLLVDDVVTTGATMKYATRALQSAGARSVWVASISRQPLD